ncbi:conserved hypothetical protein [Neospora caninum Liverpool]|uniref:Uncharacterized protein n=1 Tax=Neospora caninum (strain Liverpool) TaxID=572307 RepID=F0VGX3_NEOCL|nr:conserved hypothetical protein [Neospora caninum Liverpool]CBZ52967.1 conserved hypothetical protein [Neospora caninum Liverpool]|eukprot:XP_003882999.1 conserved hypothetical protein [Neospora caninum Liverpool]
MEGVPPARLSANMEERAPGSPGRKLLGAASQITATTIAMHPSSSVFVDLITPDASYVCSAVRVLPASISSRNRELPAVSSPIPLAVSNERRMQGYGAGGLARGDTDKTGGDQQASGAPFFYNNYNNYYPAQPFVPSANGTPENAGVDGPPLPARPEQYFSASVSPATAGEIQTPSQMLQLQAPSPGLYLQPSPQLPNETQYRTSEQWNPNDPRTWQTPPGTTLPPQTPSLNPSRPGPGGGTVRHPITLPVGTTVTAPVTIPITLPITSPSLSPLTIAFPVSIPGMPDFSPNPSHPRDPSPPPTSPAPAPIPPPYYPYPPYYPPRPRPNPPDGYPGYPPYYPRPPSQPFPPQTPNPYPAPPSPPVTRPPPYPTYPGYPAPRPPTAPQPVNPYPPYYPPPYGSYPPYYPYPPPQTPAPSPQPPSPRPLPDDENPPLPSPVPDRPTPPPRRPGQGGGSGSSESPPAVPGPQFDAYALAPERKGEQGAGEAIRRPSANPVSTPEIDENGERHPESSRQDIFPLRARTAAEGERPDIVVEGVVNGGSGSTIEDQNASVFEQEGSQAHPETSSDFLGKIVPLSPQTMPATTTPTAKENGSAVLSTSVRVEETNPAATISKEGININASAFDQLMAAIVAKIDSRDRSEPLFLPSICPACKVDIVTYAPIQMPDPDVESFEKARDQLTHLQRQRVPQGGQAARGGNGQEYEKEATKVSPTVEEEPTDENTEEGETVTPPQSNSASKAAKANSGEVQGIAGDVPVVVPRITSAFLEALHAAESKKTHAAETATKRQAAVVTPEAAVETEDDLSYLSSPVNRRKRPKGFRALFHKHDGTAPYSINRGASTVQETYFSENIRLSATHPRKRDEVTRGTDKVMEPSVYRSRLDAGEDEGAFVVMFACYHPDDESVEPLLMANLEVRVSR